MNNHLKSQGAVIFRSKDNAHRYFYFLNGKLRSFLTDEKDVLNNLAAMFGSLNALFATPQTQFLKTALSLSLLAYLSSMGSAYALPEGGQSVAGNVQFSNPNATTLNVTTNANRSIANYRAFSIGHGETVNFYLPGSDSAILNRVVGRSASEIFGNINSNGQVYLVNPNGIIFGSSAQVNVGSLFASTLGISDQDFLAGRMVFTQDPTYAPASVVNQGIINIQQGGHAVFAGSAVANSGTINAPQGQVHLVVGDQVSMLMGDGIVADVKVDRALQAKVEGLQDAISNSGNIKADGGIVKLQAELQNNIYDRLVNNSGRIEAFSVEDHDGVVSFVGHSQDGMGLVQNNGTVDVSGSVANVHGGKILIDADNIENNGALIADAGDGGTAGHIELDANNETFLNDGSLISAKAGANGNGGYVRIWSDKNTYFNPGASILANGGSESGDGGFVEVSAKDNIDFRGLVDIGANNGNSGTLLIDPTDFTINAGNVGALTAVNGNVLIWANRDIFVNTNAFFFNQNLSSETLTLRAGRDITVNNDLSTNGSNLTLLADADMTGTVPGGTTSPGVVGPGPFGGTASDGVGTISINGSAQVDSNDGNITMVAAGIQNNSSGVGVEANNGNLTMTVTGNGNIGGTGRYDADGNTTITAGTGNVNINTEIDELTVNSGGNVTINEAGAVDINGAVITGDFTLTADQDISVDGAVSGRNISIRSISEDLNVNANITGQDTVSLRAGSGFFDQLSIGNFGGVTNRLVSAKTVNLRAETVRVYGNGRVTATGTNASGPALFDDNAGTAAPPIVTGNTYTAAAGGNGVVNIDGKLNNTGVIRAEGGNGGSGITINYASSNLNLTNVTLNAASGGAAGSGTINIINDDGAGNNGTLQNLNGTAGVAGPVNITTTGGNSISGTGVAVSGTGLNLNSAGSTTLSGNFNSLPISTISVGSASITQTGATSLNITNAVASGLNSNLTFNAQGGNVTLGPVSLNAGNLDVTAGNGGILINNNITGATNVTMTTNESAEAVAANISGAGKINASGNTVLNSKDDINVNTATVNLAAKADGNVIITEDDAVNLNTIGGVANSAGSNYNLITLNGGMTLNGNVTGNSVFLTTYETAEGTASSITSAGGKVIATNFITLNSMDDINVNTAALTMAAKADGNVTITEDDAVNLSTVFGVTNSAGGNYNVTTANGGITVNNNINATNITLTTNETSEATNSDIRTTGSAKLIASNNLVVNSKDNIAVYTATTHLAAKADGSSFVEDVDGLNLKTIDGVTNSAGTNWLLQSLNGGYTIQNNVTAGNIIGLFANETSEATNADITTTGGKLIANTVLVGSMDNINVTTAATHLSALAYGDATVVEDDSVNLRQDPTYGFMVNYAGGNYNLTTNNGGVTIQNNVIGNNITITTNETAEATNADIASTGGKLIATNNLVVNSKDNINVNTATVNLAAKADGNVTVNEDDAVNLNTISGITNTAGGNYNLTTTNGAVQALANVTGGNITITTNETSEATNANIFGPGKFVTTGTANFISADDATVNTQAVNLAGNVAGNFTVTEDNDLNVLATSVGNHLILNAATGKVNVQGNVSAKSAALTVSSLTVDATGANTGKITVTNGIDGGPGATPTLAITSPNGVTLRGGAAADSGSIVVTNGNANIQATNGILSLQAGNGNNSGSLLMNAVSGSPVLTLNTRGLTTNAVFSQGTYSGSLVTNSPLNLVFTGTASGEGLNLNGSSKPNGGIFTNGNNLTVTAAQYNINGPINVGAADVNLLFNNSGRVFLGDANFRITNPNSNDVVLNNFELNNISANNLLIGNGATNKQYLFDVMNTTGKNVTLQTTGAFTDNTGGLFGLFPDTAAKTNITLASGKNLTLIGGNNNIGGSGNADIDILLTGGGTLKVTTTGGSVFVDTPGSFLIDSISAASGNVSIGAVGSVNDLGTLGSTITGNNLVMDAGSIGTGGNFLNIDMNGNLDITTSGGAAFLSEASNSLINNVNTNGGNFSLTSTGSIQDLGGLLSNINTGNGTVNLISNGAIGTGGNNLSLLSAGVVNAQSNGGNVFITDLGDFTVGEINTNSGSASLTSTLGGINDTGAVGSGLYTNGGDVTLQGGFLGGNLGSDAANPFDLYNVGLINADSNGGNISLREQGDMVVNNIDSRGLFGNGTIRLESTGKINDNGASIAVNSGGTGALTLISNGNIGDSSPLDIQVGDITATTKGGNINLNETGPMTIQSINTTTTMMVGKEPPVTITVGGDVTLTSSSTINDTGALVAIETGNDGSLTMTSNGAIGGTSPLNVNVGDITVTTTNGNNITIDEAGDMTINSIRTGGAGNVVLTAQTGIQEADAVEDNNANIVTTGQITASTVNGGIGTLTNHLDISASALNANATGAGGNVFVDQYRNPALPEGSDASLNLVGSNNATGTYGVYVVDNGALNVNGNVRATSIFMDTNNGNINVNADTEGTTTNALHARGVGSIVSGGRISGTNVLLVSDNGSIVANTNATNLNAFAAGNIFIAEANSVNLGTSSAGGSFTMFTSTLFPGIYDPNSPGTILSTGEVSGAGVNLIAAGSILDGNGGGNNVRSTGNAFLQAGGIIGNLADPFDVDIDGRLTVAIFGSENGFSGVLAGRARGNTLRVANRTPGLVLFNGRLVAGTAFEIALRTGLPALYTDLKNNLDPGFLNNREVAARIVTDGTGSTIAEIINNIIAPQPFDLRLIEEDDSNTDGVDFRLIENTSSNPPEPSEEQNTPTPAGCGEGNTDSPECQLQLQHLSSADANQN
jgi:filamentous hemagglutinin family protein